MYVHLHETQTMGEMQFSCERCTPFPSISMAIICAANWRHSKEKPPYHSEKMFSRALASFCYEVYLSAFFIVVVEMMRADFRTPNQFWGQFIKFIQCSTFCIHKQRNILVCFERKTKTHQTMRFSQQRFVRTIACWHASSN